MKRVWFIIPVTVCAAAITCALLFRLTGCGNARAIQAPPAVHSSSQGDEAAANEFMKLLLGAAISQSRPAEDAQSTTVNCDATYAYWVKMLEITRTISTLSTMSSQTSDF